MNELSITIFWSESNEGYQYDIYNQDLPEGDDRPDSIAGGLCTGSLIDALEMATQEAKELIKNN